MDSLIVRPAEPDDVGPLINLQFEVYPPPEFPPVNRWEASQIEAHMRLFPEGQPVALIDGRIVGAATTMIVPDEKASAPHTFLSIVGDSYLKNHDPEGGALYGVDILVSPFFRGRGVARALYEARFDLQRALGLEHFYAGARIPGYVEHADRMSAEEYVAKVVLGDIVDATLSKQLHLGFTVRGLLPAYLSDPETLDWAVLIDHPLREVPESEAGAG